MCGIWAWLSQIAPEKQVFQKLEHRGPDDHFFNQVYSNLWFGFHRLAIIDLSERSNQPIVQDSLKLICNGEIYNYQEISNHNSFELTTGSDCEIILPLYKKYGILDTVSKLDAEFAFILLDQNKNILHVARDPFGVRPLYWGYNDTGICFSSEAIAMPSDCYFEQFPPGCFLSLDISNSTLPAWKTIKEYVKPYFAISPYWSIDCDYQSAKNVISDLLVKSVKRRLMSDRPLGCLLSGGVDSSLTTSLAVQLQQDGHKRLHCFTIGMSLDSVDVIAARKVAEFLKIENHHIILFTPEEGFQAISDVIRHLGTYDVTTIRASTPQYLMAKYIQAKTDVRVLISGEGSDELFASYQYFKKATDPFILYHESRRLLEELHYFDNKRTDRTMSASSLEVRVPFLDKTLVQYVSGINSHYRLCNDKMEKTMLREAFSPARFQEYINSKETLFYNSPNVDRFLPDEILYRSKEAFSDAVSSKEESWYQSLVKRIEDIISPEDLQNAKYSHNQPKTREALYYRKIFEQHYPNADHLIPHYWMPRWVDLGDKWDPSATVLDCHEGDLKKKE